MYAYQYTSTAFSREPHNIDFKYQSVVLCTMTDREAKITELHARLDTVGERIAAVNRAFDEIEQNMRLTHS